MLIKIPDINSLCYPLIYREHSQDYLELRDELLYDVYDQISFEFFKDTFSNFLDCQCNSEFSLCQADEAPMLERIWESYKADEDMNISQWDTFQETVQGIWKHECSEFTCCKCGRKLLSQIPEADRDGNVYCDNCADKLLDYCEQCNERFLKSDLAYVEDGVGYCEYCKHADE